MKLSSLILAAAALCLAQSAAAADKPNIVLIFTDDLGINDLSCYGRKDQPTPNLDRMASEGLRFTCGYCSQPICSPSRAGILTGKTPGRLHLTTFLPGRPDAKSQMVLHPKINMQLPLEEKTLAEYLKDAGYTSACIGKWHLGNGAAFAPTKQGFDVAYASAANTTPSTTEGGKGEYDHTSHALQFIDDNKDKPFFLYVPFNTPHIPLAAKPELIEKHKNAFYPTYAAMMETMDDCVGLILKKLKDLNLDEKTLVIFTSDNGGLSVLEFAGGPSTYNAPYRGGKGYVYEGGLREPTIVRWPGKIKPAVIDTPISHLDFVPTLLSIVGAPVPSGLDGINIAGLWLEGRSTPARRFFWHFPHYNNQGGRPAGAVRDGDWKFVTYYDTGEKQLFNLKNDISESKDLSQVEKQRTADLAKAHETWLNEINAQRNTPNPDFDPALFKKLYVDFDPSRPILRATAAEMEKDMADWRKLMNEVVAGSRAEQKAAKKAKK
jgi:arylsulfatase A